ncbi:MAG: glucose-6-phosphate isomerase family protein [Patescibacteria group bacterium]
MLAERRHEEMREVLKDPGAKGPAVHYYMIRGGAEKKNITVWAAGLVGDEYIKTFGHYHVSDFIETYEVLAGEGIIMLQSPIADGGVLWVKAVFVKKGDKIEIPKRAGHLGVNTGASWLVTIDDSPVYTGDNAGAPKHADYEPVKKMRGFAYYVVEKKGKPEFIKNPNYKNHPDVIIEKA